MPIQIVCPGCQGTLLVPDELAGKQGRCVQCGHKLTVPAKGASPPPTAAGMSGIGVAPPPVATPPASAPSGMGTYPAPPPSPPPAPPAQTVPSSGGAHQAAGRSSIGGLAPTLFEATPEAMVRELYRRDQTALLLLFPRPQDETYDLSNVPDAELKCIATEDVNPARFAQLVSGFTKRFAPRRRGPAGTAEQLYELKGDRLGMTLEDFKRKYARSDERGQQLPICSDTAWGANRASLHAEPWHLQAGIITARIDLPTEDNSPTVAGVKTELLLYQFLDSKLFRIAAFLPTDQFHVVSEAALQKYGPVTRQTNQPRQLVWENPVASVTLTRGSVHPREPSLLELLHKQLANEATLRAPAAAADI